MRRTIRHLLWLLGLALTALACDMGTASSGGHAGASRRCVYGVAVTHANGGEIGEGCTDNNQCMYGVCLKPSTRTPDPTTGMGTSNGNMTNTVFGFCTRGCDCADSAASRLSDTEKKTSLCISPPGHYGGWRHVVLKCTKTASCGNADTKWNGCAMPLAGGTYPVCQAHVK